MKKYLKSAVWALLLSFAPMCVNAQDGLFEKANHYYNSLAYYEAIPVYLQVLKADSTNVDALVRLADCYRLTSQFSKALKTYDQVVKLNEIEPIQHYYYGKSLMENGQYNKALPIFEENVADPRGKTFTIACDKALNQKFEKYSSCFSTAKVTFNTRYNDFSPAIYKDMVVFTSSRPRTEWVNYKNSWSGNYYAGLFYVTEKDKKFSKPKRFSKGLEAKYNNGPVSFSTDGRKLYFTRNNVEYNQDVRANNDGEVKLKIYEASYSNKKNKYRYAKPLPFNSKEYNCTHPAISPDKTKLYFTSDMCTGSGQMDIWFSEKVNNVWTKPVNLGFKVNTKGNEVFPYVSESNVLYFASDGLEGLGGLDIFRVQLGDNGMPVGKVRNIGKPVNTPGDDFGVCLYPGEQSGFFCSNYNNPNNNDDIYAIYLKFCAMGDTLKGGAVDKFSKEVVGDVKVCLFDSYGELIDSLRSDENGKFVFDVDNDEEYTIIASKKGYHNDTIKVTTQGVEEGGTVSSEAKMEKLAAVRLVFKITDSRNKKPLAGASIRLTDKFSTQKEFGTTNENGEYIIPISGKTLGDSLHYDLFLLKDGYFTKNVSWAYFIDKIKDIPVNENLDTLTTVIKIDPIFFDYNSSVIREDATKELDHVVEVMKANPLMKIDLKSHTDCRGDVAYNQKLSDDRAKATIAYLIKKGADKNRLTGKGYGKSLPDVKCDCATCTEQQHQANRRTEFVIVK